MGFKSLKEKLKNIEEAKIQKFEFGVLPLSGKSVSASVFALESNKKDAIEIVVDGKVKGIFYINEDGSTSFTEK